MPRHVTKSPHAYAHDVAGLNRVYQRITSDEERPKSQRKRLGEALLIVIRELQSEMLPAKDGT